MRRCSVRGVMAGLAVGASWGLTAGCGDDEGTAADRLGVAAECSSEDACPTARRGEQSIQLTCLAEFRGGYCGIADCQGNEDCPDGSGCVNHDDGNSYCFRVCADKPECNRNRTTENEANCSSNVEFAEVLVGTKACVPPSSGT